MPWFLRFANFETLPGTTEALFIFSTGDGWDDEMVTLRSVMPEGDQWQATLFFVVFQLMSQFVLMNLFVMVIIEAYEVLDDADRHDAEAQIPVFQEVWGRFDPEAIGIIRPDELRDLLVALPAGDKKLGFRGKFAAEGIATVMEHNPGFNYTFQEILTHLSEWLGNMLLRLPTTTGYSLLFLVSPARV